MPEPVIPKIIGIAGATCSGKTTLEKNLQEKLGDSLAVLPFDDMFVGLHRLQDRKVNDWESPDLYRWLDLLAAVKGLRGGNEVTIAAHSRESTKLGIDTRVIAPKKYVIVAGFLTLHNKEIRSCYDLSLYIDLPEAEILRRRKLRADPNSPWDSEQYIQEKLIPGHRRYVEPQRRFAGQIIDGTQPRDVLARHVLDIIESLQ